MLVAGVPTTDTDSMLARAQRGRLGGPTLGGSRAVPPGLPSTSAVQRATAGYEAPTSAGSFFTGHVNSVQRAVPPSSRGVVDSPWMRDNQITPIKDAVKSIEQGMSDFWEMQPKKRYRLAQKLWLAGLVPNAAGGLQDASLEDVSQGYEKLLALSADRLSMGKLVTPWSLLQDLIEFRVGDLPKGMSTDELYNGILQGEGGVGGSGGGGGQQGPITSFHVNRVVDLTSPEEAKAFLRVAMQELLGRDPSEEEVEDYISMLNTEEEDAEIVSRTKTRQNPNGSGFSRSIVRQDGDVLSRSRTTVDRQGNETTRERTFGEPETVDPGLMAEEQARRNPNYAEYQAVATYLPALMEMLGPVA